MTTRQDLIDIMHDRLGLLATTAGLSALEGHYMYPLDAALRALTGGTTIPTDEDAYVLNDVLDVFEMMVLKKLRNYYTFYVDTTVGPRKESFSQLLNAVEKRIKESPISVNSTFDLGEFDGYGTGSFSVDWFETDPLWE